MIKGKEQRGKESKSTKYVGLTDVEVKAINPTRAELNELLGREDGDEIEYISEDRDGNKRVRLTFWLRSNTLGKYFPHSINLIDKVRLSSDGLKTQFVNNVCFTSWADEQENLQSWFTDFLDKEKKSKGTKSIRKALVGEEELVALLRTWVAVPWSDPETSVFIDNAALLEGDVSELRGIIGSGMDSQFVVMLGVRTDESDATKQYQQVYGKAFLPGSMWSGITSGFVFKNDYTRKTWERFDENVNGQYGFNSYFEMIPAVEYDPAKDIATSDKGKVDITPTNPKF